VKIGVAFPSESFLLSIAPQVLSEEKGSQPLFDPPFLLVLLLDQ
jgi:hypothetical protein